MRFLVGDTDTNDQKAQDEEIDWVLTIEADIFSSAARVCEALAAKYAATVDKAVGDLKLTASQKHEQYKALAAELRKRGANYMMPTIGGLKKADRDATADNDDLIAPFFTRRMHQNPQTISVWREVEED